MIKCKIISGWVGAHEASLRKFNEDVIKFIENLSIEGHTFISCNTICIGKDGDRLRTEIIYRENQTRKVIVEKSVS